MRWWIVRAAASLLGGGARRETRISSACAHGDVAWVATPLRGCDRKPSESTVTKVQRATLDDHDDIVPHSAVIRINRNDDPDGGLWVSTGEAGGHTDAHMCAVWGWWRAGRRSDSEPAADVYFTVSVVLGAAPCVMRGFEAGLLPGQNKIESFCICGSWSALWGDSHFSLLLLRSAAGFIPVESDLKYRVDTQNFLGRKL